MFQTAPGCFSGTRHLAPATRQPSPAATSLQPATAKLAKYNPIQIKSKSNIPIQNIFAGKCKRSAKDKGQSPVRQSPVRQVGE